MTPRSFPTSRLFRTAVPALALLLALPAAASGQGNILEPAVPLAQARLVAPAGPSDSAQSATRRQDPSKRTTRLFYGALLAGAALSFNYSVDPDAGGYEDTWSTLASFPDKGVHALAAFALTGVGVDLGARPWMAAASVCAAGAAFELSQGYVSRIDIAADCIGAAGAALWRSWRTRVDERNGR